MLKTTTSKILSIQKYSYYKHGKETKSISRFIRHLNICIKEISQTAYLHKLYDDKIDTLDGDLEDRNELLDKTNHIIRDTIDLSTKRIPQDRLLASEFLSSLRKMWFTRNEFLAGTPVSDIKYNHLRLKDPNSFYPFND